MNGLSYYDYTFFEELPRLYASLEDQLAAVDPVVEYDRAAVLPAHGQLDRRRPRRQSVRDRGRAASGPAAAEPARARVLSRQVNLLGGELSLDGNYVAVSEQVQALAEFIARPFAAPAGRTLSPRLVGYLREPRGDRRPDGPRRNRASCGGRCAALRERRRNWQAISRSSIARCCRTARAHSPVDGFAKYGAPSACSASILPASTCGRTPTCMSAWSHELLEKAIPGTGYASLPEDERVALLLEELRTPRLLASPYLGYSDETASELAIVREAANAHRLYGARLGAQLRDLEGKRSVRHSRSSLAAEGSGTSAPARGRDGRQHRAALRDHRRFAQRGRRHGRAVRIAGLHAPAAQPRPGAGGHARIFGQQQGWRLSHLGLGALQGRDRADRGVSARYPLPCVFFTVAAAPSAAAAGRAIRRFWRSRAAPCRAPFASPSRARSSPANTRTAISDSRNLEILAAATLEASLLHSGQSAPRDEYLAAMEELSDERFNAYRGLVYETEGFERYFWESTVIGEIANLNIGSRPASRTNSRRIEDLRAIPWVFGWAQCRLMLPGWYGFGSAVDAWLKAHPENGMPLLQEMYREWPFFQAMISNMDMVLAKSNIAIASQYAKLVEDTALREAIFPRIRREWESSIAKLLSISGQDTLLDGNPLLARSIRNRFPVSRPAQPPADRVAETSSRGRSGRARGGGHPSVDQRHRGGPSQQRIDQVELVRCPACWIVALPRAEAVATQQESRQCPAETNPATPTSKNARPSISRNPTRAGASPKRKPRAALGRP